MWPLSTQFGPVPFNIAPEFVPQTDFAHDIRAMQFGPGTCPAQWKTFPPLSCPMLESNNKLSMILRCPDWAMQNHGYIFLISNCCKTAMISSCSSNIPVAFLSPSMCNLPLECSTQCRLHISIPHAQIIRVALCFAISSLCVSRYL